MKARRLEFGYLRAISSADEKSFPMLIRTVSMKELLVIFPSVLIGLILFLRHQVIYSAIPLMFAFYVLVYNEKSVPFYYQFIAFITDFTGKRGEKGPEERKAVSEVERHGIVVQKGKKPGGREPSSINTQYFAKYKKELEQLSLATVALSVILYTLQLEIYMEKINFVILIGLSVTAGLLLSFVVIRLSGLVSKR